MKDCVFSKKNHQNLISSEKGPGITPGVLGEKDWVSKKSDF